VSRIAQDAPGKTVLLMGNEAIARGALEAGVKVCAAYPGNPSSEIIGSLCSAADALDLHVEWSVNEKVAMEVVAAASFAGLRGLCSMKQNGLNVASDFLINLNLTGTHGGLGRRRGWPGGTPPPMRRTRFCQDRTSLLNRPRFRKPGHDGGLSV
jgi:indolepyruvate ferredoxin oxidoreductase alpha subunit